MGLIRTIRKRLAMWFKEHHCVDFRQNRRWIEIQEKRNKPRPTYLLEIKLTCHECGVERLCYFDEEKVGHGPEKSEEAVNA